MHADGWTVGGMAKGAGMLAPGLATMLCVLTTDAVVDADRLDAALRDAARRTFDRVDADGCMSTNDTVVLLASGASGIARSVAGSRRGGRGGLRRPGRASCSPTPRARQRRSPIEVGGAAREDDAVEVGRAIARNNLLKCALFGNDPNWGRVLAAIGTTRRPSSPMSSTSHQRRPGLPRGRGRGAADRVDLSRARRAHRGRPARRRRERHHLDQRPVARLRRRELGVLVMSRRPRRRAGRRPSDSRSTRCRGWSGSTARSSWSSTAATR